MVKKNYITFASVISAFAVICLHTNNFWSFRISYGWVFSNFIESFFYFAVPVFFMISGVTLFDYSDRYSTREFFKKRIVKTVIPFFFWSVIAVPFSKFILNAEYDLTLRSFLSMILKTEAVSYYWFFIPLFSVYLLIPVFTRFDKKIKIKVFKYCIITTFIINYLLPLVANILNVEYNVSFQFNLGMGYIIYCMLGYLIDNIEISKRLRYVIYILGIIGFFIHFFGTWFLSYQQGALVTVLKDYLKLHAYLYSIAVFLFFKYFFRDKEIKKSLIIFSKETFSVYLLQYFFISFISLHLDVLFDKTVYRFIMAFVLFVAITIISKALKKIPGMKYVLPS